MRVARLYQRIAIPDIGQLGGFAYDRDMNERLSYQSESPEETVAWAAAWVKRQPDGTVIALRGDLGAGKTCFVRGLAAGLGFSGSVHSPTFTLINEYRGPRILYHLDLYRLAGPDDAWEIGIDQYLPGDGITAIEWAERIKPLLPSNTVFIELRYGDEINQRVINVNSGVAQ